ncbi:MAG: phospholipid scramblase-related protein [Mycobacteriales bacterium]
MTESPQRPGAPAAGWYADPSGQFEQRYWDGATWTAHVVRAGQQSVSPLAPRPPEPVRASAPERVQRQVQHQAGIAPFVGGGGTIFDSPVLVVNQKAKLIEITNEYAVYDHNGTQLGSVVEVGQSAAKKLVRVLTNYDQFLTHRLEVRDMSGRALLHLTRPAKFVKSKVVVATPDGRELGTIRQENAIGKIRFAFEVGAQRVGGIQAENWRAWDFAIVDAQGGEVARIKKTWEGLAKTMFTTADNYVVRIHRPLEEPLRTLVIASALTVDTALKQDSRGFS